MSTTTDQSPAQTPAQEPAPRFSAEAWASFWADPFAPQALPVLADDIVGHWPDDARPVVGLAGYSAKISALLEAVPDLRLELVDSATVPGGAPDEELVFLHYVGRGTGPAGPFTFRGLDRVRSRAGVVVENVIRYSPDHVPLG